METLSDRLRTTVPNTMRIDAIDSYRLGPVGCVSMHPIAERRGDVERQDTPTGCVETHPPVLVRIESGGMSGWGEASPGAAPTDRDEWTGGVFACLADCLAPALVGETIDSGEELQHRLAVFRGNAFAKGAFDCAWWDLHARRRGQSLVDLIGGQPRTLRLGTTLPLPATIDDLLANIAAARDAGYDFVTLKFRPGWALEMLRAVREQFSSLPLRLDGDGLATLDQRDLFLRVADFDVDILEQPLEPADLVGHAMLQESLRTTIALDQSVASPRIAEQALDLGSCRAINVVPDRVGGLTNALAIVRACQEAHVRCYVAASPCTAVGSSHAATLASLTFVDDSCELPLIPSRSQRETGVAHVQPTGNGDRLLEPRQRNGKRILDWHPPIGIGWEPNAAALHQAASQHRRITS